MILCDRLSKICSGTKCFQPLREPGLYRQENKKRAFRITTLLGPQSRSRDRPVNFSVVCPQGGTAVLKGLNRDEQRE